ncbi:hypothetical protein T552_00176 [Pneumocystis carinii B80]|uniref:Pheromone a factor receptor n=2 Tax=Pneumocystis carinii TaxID=4754 RepID=A0A0W4ZT25_PNEC8|nr:hypothetical protein T552_00176 [Pneumocystis carinii B80]AAG02576.1 pheromone receptor a [Pneumocystis carinii]AAG38548.1 putative a-factor pheromone receptor Ste3b [Pneumocystis carinii]KTW31534.1 hypothetical protein T552_00176 [Pneumocystis carinii B80]
MGEAFYIFFCLIGFLCSIIPSIWHWKYRNVAPLCLIFWVSSTNLVYFINSIIWYNGSETSYRGDLYCDIVTKLILGSVTGELGATAAITHYLSKIMKPSYSFLQSKITRRNQAIEDLLFSFGPPIMIMSLHYIVQPARYVIDGTSGCMPWTDRSWLAVAIVLLWPPVFGSISAYYSVKVIISYIKKRNEFQTVLKDSKTSMTLSRFIRLIGLSSLIITIYLPLNIYLLIANIAEIIRSNIKYSWSHVHNWSSIIFYVSKSNMPFNRWLSPSSGIIIFIFFGMGSDAIVMYKEIAKKLYITHFFHFIQRKIFRKKTQDIKDAENYYNSYSFEKSLGR